MTNAVRPSLRPEPSFAELFTPKLVTVLREGYGWASLRADVIAGVTVAMVALPLSMAIAKASGMTPDRGLYTAIIGGFLISALGGSRFQIGGPAGAFIVLVASVIERHGIDGLLLATLMAGVFLLAIGFLRLGTYIKYIPHPVTVGFTSGIAVIIFASQITDLLGLTLPGREPAAFLPKLAAIRDALPTVTPAAVAVALASIALILILRRLRPHWPGFLVAIVAAAGMAAVLSWMGYPIATIGSKFGGIPSTLPAPALPPISFARMADLLPDALAIALLGGIESLLSAVVADGMSGRRHRSNCELVAQGFANIGSAIFGGMCATGTIARTATNVRAGGRSPIAGIVHSATLLVLMLVAAPLASYIPLAALAAVLAIVSWNMAERVEFAAILRRSRGDSAVLLVTFLLVVFRDLTEGIAVGVVMGSILFMHRMAQLVEVQTHAPVIQTDVADAEGAERVPYEGPPGADEVVVYTLTGPFFFGAAAEVAAVLDRIGQTPRVFVLDMSGVPFVDSTAAQSLAGFVRKATRNGTRIVLSGASAGVRRVLDQHEIGEPDVTFTATVADAMATKG
ncbi:MAG: SulP family inorganic anion transporter [Burkholderiales bacterium]|nr:SulP family inorganic anion transporter [Burkholderiales bacterium]